MKRSFLALWCALLAIGTNVLSCRSEDPALVQKISLNQEWKGLPAPSDSSGINLRNVNLLDSNTGAGSDTVVAPGSVAQPSTLEAVWASGVQKGTTQSSFASIAQDKAGNTYAAGSLVLGPVSQLGNKVSVHGLDVVINSVLVKYDVSGKPVWARSPVEGTAGSEFYSVVVDASGNIYAAGRVEKGMVGFGGTARVEGLKGSGNLLLVKYDSTGQAQWARSLASSEGRSQFNSVAVDKAGYVYVAGSYWTEGGRPIDLSHQGPRYVVRPDKVRGVEVAVLAKYDPSGSVIWAALVSGRGGTGFESVSIDGTGNIYVAGTLSNGQYALGNDVLLDWPCKTVSGMVVKYNASGKAIWARTLVGASDNCVFRSINVDRSGNAYIAGVFYGQDTYDFGNNLTLQGPSKGPNLLMVQYDTGGVPMWARSLREGQGDCYFHSVTTGGGLAFLAGSIRVDAANDKYDFGVEPPVALGNFRGAMEFLVAYSSSGTPRWVQMPLPLGLAQAQIESMFMTDNGELIVAGSIYGAGTVDLGNGVGAECIGSYSNLFVARYRVLESTPLMR